MASDRRNLNRIPSLDERQPLETADSDISDAASATRDNDSSPEAVSSAVALPQLLSKRVSSAFRKSKDNDVSVHEVDQTAIELVFREIQRHNRLRIRQRGANVGSRKGSVMEDSKKPPIEPTEASAIDSQVEVKFRSSFNDTVSTPVYTSIMDSEHFIEGQFFGFYVAAWLSVTFYIVKHMVQSEFTDQLPLYKAPVFKIFTHGLVKVALTDLAMYLSIYVVFFIQVLCAKNIIQWRKTGRALTSIYEAFFMVFWIYFVVERIMKDQWIGRTFLILHMFVLFMKMHSYAFYNGYLWKILRELQFSEDYLERLHLGSVKLPTGYNVEETKKLLAGSIAFCKFELLHQSLALDKADDKKTLEMDSTALCSTYLSFPKNIDFSDFFMFTMFPTVLYSLKFARNERIRWRFVLEKVAAMVGIIFIMLLIAEYNLYQPYMNALKLRKVDLTSIERLNLFVMTCFDLVPEMFLEYLLTFYLIWHVILNLIAEVTRFADRDFYGHWWALLDWEEFSRLWNKPVHKFLLRHVYHSSISAFSLSKSSGVLLTFFISSVIHELMMYVVFGRVKGFLFFFQMFQLPLILINKSPLLKNHKTIRNILCWGGLILAPGMIPSFYLVF